MFVRQSTHDKLQDKFNSAVREYWRMVSQRDELQSKYSNLAERWNELTAEINYLGGREFLENATIGGGTVTQFTEDELRSLLQLVHPDKHGGKESAHRLTQKINQLRNKA